MRSRGRAFVGFVAAMVLMVGTLQPAVGHDQHGPTGGHLHGPGAWGNIELVSVERVTSTPELVADVAVSPDGKWAYLANWGEPDCAGPERGGQTSPDAGAWVVDISDLRDPKTVGFIPSSQDTRPGEGMQVVPITTRFFNGDMLVMNNEQCGKNGKGGVSLYDVTDPRKPMKLSEHFGDRGAVRDANDIHSAFAWDAGDNAYVVIVDNFETTDVDILDITNPRRPRLIQELSLVALYPGITQVQLGLTQVFLHDMTVKQIGGRWVMLLSYWDGGFVQLDVTDPANPTLIGDTDYTYPDPRLHERTRAVAPPDGNGHQAEFTADNRFFIGTDEDFAPFGATSFEIASPATGAGTYASVPVPGAAPIQTLPDRVLNGPTVYGGYGCAASTPIPRPENVSGYLQQLGTGEEKILVLQRGPSGDPSAPEPGCRPGEKAHSAAQAGWDAVLIVQFHSGTEAPPYCGAGGFAESVVAVCTTHEAYHKLFGQAVSTTYPDGPAIGAIGGRIRATARFDGWGYVHLFSNTPRGEKFPVLDTYSIPEAHDAAYATGYGDLTVHEVATDPRAANRAYLSYYNGGLRSLEIRCTGPACELVEIGGYLDPNGNNFWGVEVFVRDGQTYILASDMDSGLWIFRAKSTNG